jgi:hypothetical protein
VESNEIDRGADIGFHHGGNGGGGLGCFVHTVW